MSLFGSGESSTTAKPLLEGDNAEVIVDERTKKGEEDAGGGEDEEAEQAKATALALAETEMATRKETALAAGKTEEEFEAEETANANKTPEELAEEKRVAEEAATKKTNDEKIVAEARQAFLESLGVKTEEELRAKLNPAKPKTEEEQKAEAELYTASLAQFAVKQKIFTNDEWLGFNNMRKMPDSDLVMKDFENTYRELNKERKLEDGKPDPVTDDEVKDKFSELYHIDSENATLKEQGEKNIALKAKAIKEPLETKFNDVKEIYDGEMAQKQAVPSFRTFFQSALKEAIPTSFEYGEGDEKFTYDLSKLDKDELEQHFIKEIGDREFTDFLKGKGSPEQRARIQKEVTKEILYRNHKDIAKQSLKAGVSLGKLTAAPGANARFTEPGKNQQKQQGVKVTEADNTKVAGAFA